MRSFDAGAPSTTTTASRHKTDRITRQRMFSKLIRTQTSCATNKRQQSWDANTTVCFARCVHTICGRLAVNRHDESRSTAGISQPVPRYDDITGRAQNYAKFLSNRNLGYLPFSAFCASTANSEIKYTPPCCNVEHCKRTKSVNNDRKYPEYTKLGSLSITAKFPWWACFSHPCRLPYTSSLTFVSCVGEEVAVREFSTLKNVKENR